MKTKLLIFLMITFPMLAFSQLAEDDRLAITKVMMNQQDAWNEGNIEEFMEGYWKSDSLRFTSSGRSNMGWQNTLNGYKKAYPTKDIMGQLKFEIFDIYPIVPGSAALTGSYYLTRDPEDASGFFTLIWKKLDDQWLIISDMTCSD